MLDFVEGQYAHILDEPEYRFYRAFHELTEDAKCLYIRLSNRRGDFFRMNKISYTEISCLEEAKAELFKNRFIAINESSSLEQFSLFTKGELLGLFDFLDKKQRKSELLETLSELDLPTLHEKEELLEVKKNEEVEFIKLLFFGKRGGQMTDFVIRDVGNVKIEPLDESQFKPWFTSREEALAVSHVSQLKTLIRQSIHMGFPIEVFLEEVPWAEWLLHPRATKPTEKLLLEIAYHFEQRGEMDLAVDHYAYVQRHPSRERRIRLFQKMDREEEAIKLAQEILTEPQNATEHVFASDYLAKSGIRISRSMTKMLKNAPTITISKDPKEKVEQAVLHHFASSGWEGFHTENFAWRGLFGLVFWEELFDEGHGSFHHPLQRQPSDLDDTVFFQARVRQLNERLAQIKSKKALLKQVANTYDAKNGIANRFIVWHEGLLFQVQCMVAKLPLRGIKAVLLEMAKDMKENSTGFPDLFIWKGHDYHFYEVKSPNDHLSAQQLFWIEFLNDQKITADVLRVSYS